VELISNSSLIMHKPTHLGLPNCYARSRFQAKMENSECTQTLKKRQSITTAVTSLICSAVAYMQCRHLHAVTSLICSAVADVQCRRLYAVSSLKCSVVTDMQCRR
jgi:hypothetical protein